jgi:hypothetical protein
MKATESDSNREKVTDPFCPGARNVKMSQVKKRRRKIGG